jgi:hypothetical protein
MEKIDFKKVKYDTDLILGHFNLIPTVNNCEVLKKLINTTGVIEEPYIGYLEFHRQRLEFEGNAWNEEELKMHFLAHVLSVAKIDEPQKLKLFYERPLRDTVNGIEIAVICDCMIAKPFSINTPQVPYFFLQEFKKAKKPDDPEGQMLLAMIAAQHLNADNKPVYGCWLQGKNWTFTTLHDKNYCVSRQYDASISEELYQIIYILRNLKKIILE